jgi:hypothetical protein
MSLSSEQDSAPLPPIAGYRAIPRSVIALGFVSLFMDTSSEIIHSLLPSFLVTVLGVSALSVGIIEGIAAETIEAVRKLLDLAPPAAQSTSHERAAEDAAGNAREIRTF